LDFFFKCRNGGLSSILSFRYRNGNKGQCQNTNAAGISLDADAQLWRVEISGANAKKLNIFPLSQVQGTVGPDWICMRVVSLESPLKGHQGLNVFNF
jgi:hypothetical protein